MILATIIPGWQIVTKTEHFADKLKHFGHTCHYWGLPGIFTVSFIGLRYNLYIYTHEGRATIHYLIVKLLDLDQVHIGVRSLFYLPCHNTHKENIFNFAKENSHKLCKYFGSLGSFLSKICIVKIILKQRKINQ